MISFRLRHPYLSTIVPQQQEYQMTASKANLSIYFQPQALCPELPAGSYSYADCE